MLNFIKKLTGAEDIKELIYTQNNNILAHERATEKLMREYEKDNARLSKELEIEKANNTNLAAIVNGQELEIQRLTRIIEDNKKFKEDIKEYLKTVAEILQNNQKEFIKKKVTLVDLKTEKMNKISESAKAKLK